MLSLFLLGCLRERISHERKLCKLFLNLNCHAVADVLLQMPSNRRTSAHSTHSVPMTHVGVTKVSIICVDEDQRNTVVASTLTNTRDMNPVNFLGLLCYMVRIRDAAYVWFLEEFRGGAQRPSRPKQRAPVAAAGATVEYISDAGCGNAEGRAGAGAEICAGNDVGGAAPGAAE